MSRPLRLEYSGAFYHAFSRGNARQTVFHEPVDYDSFLDLLGETCLRYDWHCHAHCLMPNHYHLLVETRSATLSAGMRHLNGVFTQRYNRRRKRVGHVFQGRFKALLVQDERYLLELARYIVLNPVRARLVDQAADWCWSSHGWLMMRAQAPAWAAPDAVWSRLAGSPADAAQAFSRYLGETHDVPAVGWSADGVLGDEGFKRSQTDLIAARRSVTEMPLAMRVVDRPPLSQLLCGVWRRGGCALDEQIHVAVSQWRYSQDEIARHLGISRRTVANAIARLRIAQNPT
jgi:REP element-mobilizing transposase RayT